MDVKLLYPLYAEILNHTERNEPEVFNYVCIHGRQIFFRKVNNRYQVLCVGWSPKSFKCTDILTDKHIVFVSQSYEASSLIFNKCIRELISYNVDEFDFGD